MRLVPHILLVAMLALCGPTFAATVREISASELRKIVSAGDAVSLKRAISAVSKTLGGEPIEARAFDAEGVFYRIVMKRSNGTLFSVIIDAETGRQVSKNSSIGKQISAAAASEPGLKTSKSKTAEAKKNDKGNSNAGGNGKSNGGGNGNSGGNGNGNGGGNGNSGGNGNGNGNGGGNGNGKN